MKRFLTSTVILCALGAHGQWLTDSLIAHFPMNGSPNDTVGGLVPILTFGAPSFCVDRVGVPDGAACFDGNDFWRYGDVLEVDSSAFSISFWCRIDGLTPGSLDHDYPLAKGTTAFGNPPYSGYAFGFRDELPDTLSAACLWGQGNQPVIIKDHPVSYGVWTHYTMSRCFDDIVLLHVNGVHVSTDTLDAAADLTTNIYFGIGAGDRAPSGQPVGGYFRGAIDDIRIYKGRCLTQAEISSLADLTVGITEIGASVFELHLSPNPATQTLRIDLTSSENITGPLLVLNALGQAVPIAHGSLVRTSLGVRSLTVDVSGLPNGAYFVVVPTEKGRSHGRFVKE